MRHKNQLFFCDLFALPLYGSCIKDDKQYEKINGIGNAVVMW